MKTIHKIIVDRKSSYSLSYLSVKTEAEIKAGVNYLKNDKKLKKATHNSYAFRYQNSTQIIEGKNDDGEKGAGNIILNYLQNNNLNSLLVVVSRYYGGIKLGADRFKNIQKTLDLFFKDNKLKN
ncbi:MAG: YigZ family protein [Candidatus Pacebacteria bacterium]|nr:YigZ family protein [Candidatus Paceibacterota bacterium]